MNTSTIAKLIAGAWQAEAKTVVLPDGSVVAVPEKPEGMRDEWIEPLMAVALFVLDRCDRTSNQQSTPPTDRKHLSAR